MQEKGVMKQILENYEGHEQFCPDLSGLPLGFNNCFTAFGVMFFGLGLSVCFVICELFTSIIVH
jgi:hypothetical protein